MGFVLQFVLETLSGCAGCGAVGGCGSVHLLLSDEMHETMGQSLLLLLLWCVSRRRGEDNWYCVFSRSVHIYTSMLVVMIDNWLVGFFSASLSCYTRAQTALASFCVCTWGRLLCVWLWWSLWSMELLQWKSSERAGTFCFHHETLLSHQPPGDGIIVMLIRRLHTTILSKASV